MWVPKRGRVTLTRSDGFVGIDETCATIEAQSVHTTFFLTLYSSVWEH